MSQAKPKAKSKRYVLDESKIKQVQKLLGAATETEAIEQAIDEVIAERKRNRIVRRAHARLLKSGIEIRDVYGVLEQS